MKRIIIISVTILAILAIAFTLRRNLQEIRRAETISQQELNVVPVRVLEVKKVNMEPRYTFTGTLAPNRDLMVISQTQGLVQKVHVKTGAFVTRGREVVKVEDELMRAELMVTEANYEKARLDLERFEKMAEEDGVTKDQLEKMRLNLKNAEARYITSKKRVEDTSIKAPFSGYVNQMFTEEGSMLGPGKPVFELVDVASFKVTVKANEQEILHLDRDMDVNVTLKNNRAISLKGKIVSMAVSADMAQQYPVEVEIENTDPAMKGGMLVEVTMEETRQVPVLSIAKRHYRAEKEAKFVFKAVEGVAVKTYIQGGKENNDMIEVTDGLREGDLIIAEGIDKMSDGQKIKIISE